MPIALVLTLILDIGGLIALAFAIAPRYQQLPPWIAVNFQFGRPWGPRLPRITLWAQIPMLAFFEWILVSPNIDRGWVGGVALVGFDPMMIFGLGIGFVVFGVAYSTRDVIDVALGLRERISLRAQIAVGLPALITMLAVWSMSR